MLDLSDLKGDISPLKYFLEISKIPRPSGHTDKISEYLVDFAKKHGLEYSRDESNNIVIRKPATPGKESSPGIIIQGHTDIVAVKDEGVEIDMTREGVSCYRDGDLIKARGTSLGGDDGVAIAYALAILASEDIPHPAFEAVLTSDEETGLIGATKMSADNIKGRMLINIDSEEEGVFLVGCAGGGRCDILLPVSREKSDDKKWEISVFGLRGGHSGTEIDKGRINAISALCRVISDISDIRLISLSGGVADNAIPTSATVAVSSSLLSVPALEAAFEKMREEDGGLQFSIKEISGGVPMTRESSLAALSLIEKTPTGVISMSEDIKGLVETSANIGVVSTDDDGVSLTISVRSSKDAEKLRVFDEIREVARALGAEALVRGMYPAWEYRKDSKLRDTMCEVYRELYKKDASVVTIHAGLECGIFTGKIPTLDCVSIGPNNYDIHTTSERLSISSFMRVWEYLKAVMERI